MRDGTAAEVVALDGALEALADLGIAADAQADAAEAAATSSSMKANPALLPTETLSAIMAEA